MMNRGWAILLLAAALPAQGQEEEKTGGDGPIAGLEGEYYSLDRPVQDFFDLLVPPGRPEIRVDEKIAFDADSISKRVYIRWTGSLRVPRDGTPLRRAADLESGDPVTLHFADDERQAKIE